MEASYQSTLADLYRREARAGIDLKLDRVRRVAQALGSPHRCFRSIHVAGTNGKGSTASAAAAVLEQAGHRVGLYTSPHLVSFRERIRVSGEMITAAEVVEGIAEIDRAACSVLDDPASLTFFEITTLLGFLVFASRGVEIALVEVGLGGRLDATNIVDPEVVVITQIALDHEMFLGQDLSAVAGEKAAIIKAGRPTVTATQEREALAVVEDFARTRSSRLLLSGRDFFERSQGPDSFSFHRSGHVLEGLRTRMRGTCHRENAALALAALGEIEKEWPVSVAAVRAGLARWLWPGRLQVVSEKPQVVLDGAHNPAAIAVLGREIERLSEGSPIFLVFGAMADKRWEKMLELLLPRVEAAVLTSADPGRGAETAAMARAVKKISHGRLAAVVNPEPVDALGQQISNAPEGATVLVTGSLILIGQLLPLFDNQFASLRAAEEGASRRAAIA